MRRIEETNNGYYYADVSIRECIGWGGLGLCDTCNEPIVDGGHLIFILGSCLCDNCFNDWLSRSKRYEEDIQIQQDNSEQWFKAYLKEDIKMPDSYLNKKIETLNNENNKLQSKLSDLDKSIEEELNKFVEMFGDEV